MYYYSCVIIVFRRTINILVMKDLNVRPITIFHDDLLLLYIYSPWRHVGTLCMFYHLYNGECYEGVIELMPPPRFHHRTSWQRSISFVPFPNLQDVKWTPSLGLSFALWLGVLQKASNQSSQRRLLCMLQSPWMTTTVSHQGASALLPLIKKIQIRLYMK